MNIPPEDLAAGCAASARIKSYKLQKHARLVVYLVPGVWLFSSLARYEARASSWNCFQLVFWSLIVVAIIIFALKQNREYSRDLAFLAQLRKLYGEDISFERNIAESGARLSAQDSSEGIDRLAGLRKRGYGPLIGLVGAVSGVAILYGLRILFDKVWLFLK